MKCNTNTNKLTKECEIFKVDGVLTNPQFNSTFVNRSPVNKYFKPTDVPNHQECKQMSDIF